MRRIAIASLALVACAHAAPPPATPVPVTNAAPAPDRAAAVSDPLGFLPLTADMVMGVDLRRLRASAVWTEYAPKILALAAPGFEACGYDPLAHLDTITMAITSTQDLDGVFVLRGIDRASTRACLARHTLTKTVATFDGDLVTLTNRSGSVNMFTFVDDSTLVLVGSKHPTRESLAAALANATPLRGSKAFTQLHAKVVPGAAVWMLLAGKSKIFDKIAAGRVRTIDLAIRIPEHGGGFGLVAHAVMETEADAAHLATLLDAKIKQGAGLVDKIEATATGSVVTLAVDISDAQLRALIGMISAMMPGP